MHSDSERAKHERSKIKLLTKSLMVVRLQRQLYKLEQNKELDPLEKSKEVRMLIMQIDELISSETGDEPTSATYDKKGVLSFEKRVKKSMEHKKE